MPKEEKGWGKGSVVMEGMGLMVKVLLKKTEESAFQQAGNTPRWKHGLSEISSFQPDGGAVE